MPLEPPILLSDRLILRMAQQADIPAILEYYQVNRAYLEPFEPQRPSNFYTYEFWEAALNARVRDFQAGNSVKLFIYAQDQAQGIIGAVNLNNIVRGVFYAAALGYSLAASEQGHGYMTEAAGRLIDYAFDTLNLHRIMATYIPHNQRSGNVLQRLGFEIEGRAKAYLFINGQWQDHVLTSLINPNWRPPQP